MSARRRQRKKAAPFTVAVTPTTSTKSAAQTQQFTKTVKNVFTTTITTGFTGTWSSSDDAVGTIDTAGLATAVATGTADINYTTHNGAKDATPAVLTVT
jgi:uncharacterized protein YjdB